MKKQIDGIWIDTNELNRTLCDVLEDMRNCFDTRNFTPLSGLIEEAQIMGNKMEAALFDKDDISEWAEAKALLKKEIEKLFKQKEDLEKAVKKLKDSLQ